MEPPHLLVSSDAAVAFEIAPSDEERWLPGARVFGGGDSDADALMLWAVVVFSPSAILHGPPNDEAMAGHPLASRGLQFYSWHEVVESSWVRRLEAMNRVHPRHDEALFADRRHFVLTFHDVTLEWICRSFRLGIWKARYEDVGALLAHVLSRPDHGGAVNVGR